jgi:hypothetical protein
MSNRKPGYIKLGKFGEIPLLMHWSFLPGCVLLAIYFHATPDEVIFVCSAYAALIVFHEVGHAVAARLFGMNVFSIELSGIGGICRTEVPRSRLAALTFISAGLIVQMILVSLASIYVHYFGWPKNIAGSSITFVVVAVNSFFFFDFYKSNSI